MPEPLIDPRKPFAQELQRLVSQGVIKTQLTRSQMIAIERSVGSYATGASEQTIKTISEELYRQILDLTNPREVTRATETGTSLVEIGANPVTAREAAGAVLDKFSTGALSDRLGFALDVGRKVASGAARHVASNDQGVVDAYPALELDRFFDREVPRGFKRGPGDELIPVPDDDWPARWRHAAAASGDEDALRVLETHDRMVALKSSGIWAALGDGAGGYEDTLGNEFAPFAFNSGFRTEEVDRKEAEELGLLEEGEKATGAKIDLGSLFALP